MDPLQQGQKIRHQLYGEGVVTDSDEERTTIEFANHGVKKFVTAMMVCEVIGEAPKRKVRGRRRKARSVEVATQDAAA